MNIAHQILWLAALCGLTLAAAPLSAADKITPEQAKFFETKVRPLLAGRCYKCHGGEKEKSGLRLDARAALLKGGDSGPAIVPGKPNESLLLEAVRWESFEMPPGGQLKKDEIETLARWIEIGAPWPHGQGLKTSPHRTITDEDRKWWAYQPVKKPDVPQVNDGGWARGPIDKFIARKFEEQGLSPAPQADRQTLIRRVYFNLVGLPPSPEEIDSFVNDPSPDAYRRLIDKLLASPQYGERWGRHWLDLVRYAESDGWKQDAYRPHAWRYRDYVIKSFNEDKPYDRFVQEQIAGDEIAPDDPEALVATGFMRLGIYEYNQRDARTQWDDIVNEITDVTADVFMASGMACARCHDHKFDPILQKDYYRLQAFFEPLLWREDVGYANAKRRQEYEQKLAEWKEMTREIREKIAEIEKPAIERTEKLVVEKFPLDVQECYYKTPEERSSADAQMAYLVWRQVEDQYDNYKKRIKKERKQEWEELRKQLAEFDKHKPKPLPSLMTVSDAPTKISPTTIPGKEEPIAPGFLTVLDPSNAKIESTPATPESSGRRAALARWLTSPENPLTARVIVNRIWQYHFGRGIVGTPSDFGHLGEKPTHPELLDWLAATFVEQGWSMKQLHRMILLSAAYQQSVHHPQAASYQEVDPINRYFWRADIRRLSAEQVRDAMLAVSGELQLKQGGPSVDDSQPRRTIYTKFRRNSPDPLLKAFDVPDGLRSTAERNVTTTVNQALLMVNGGYALKRAKALAKRLERMKFDDDEQLVNYAFRLTAGKAAPKATRQRAVAFLKDESMKRDEALLDFCHVLLNSNAFLYVE